MSWHLYILTCNDDTLYTGITKTLDQRLDEHNSSPKGAKYTRSRRPVVLSYHECHETRSDALKRELAVKKLSRAQKLELIRSAVASE